MLFDLLRAGFSKFKAVVGEKNCAFTTGYKRPSSPSRSMLTLLTILGIRLRSQSAIYSLTSTLTVSIDFKEESNRSIESPLSNEI